MANLKRALLAAGFLAVGSCLFAQTTGGGNTGGGNQGGAGGPIQATIAETPTISSTSGGGVSRGNVDQSNLLGGYYANPLYQGARTTSGGLTSVVAPGGFGQSTFQSGGGTTGGGVTGSRATGGTNRTGSTMTGGLTGGTTAGRTGGTTTGLGGTTGGLGGTTGGLGTTNRAAGGFGGATGGVGGRTGGFGGTTGANSAAQQLSTGRNIAYTSTPKFAISAVAAPALASEVRSVLDSSSSIASARGIASTADADGMVVLTGSVTDEDEARLVEGLILLTPGVKGVKNELKYPKP